MQKDYDYYQLNNRAAAIHKHQQYQERIKEQQTQIEELKSAIEELKNGS